MYELLIRYNSFNFTTMIVKYKFLVSNICILWNCGKSTPIMGTRKSANMKLHEMLDLWPKCYWSCLLPYVLNSDLFVACRISFRSSAFFSSALGGATPTSALVSINNFVPVLLFVIYNKRLSSELWPTTAVVNNLRPRCVPCRLAKTSQWGLLFWLVYHTFYGTNICYVRWCLNYDVYGFWTFLYTFSGRYSKIVPGLSIHWRRRLFVATQRSRQSRLFACVLPSASICWMFCRRHVSNSWYKRRLLTIRFPNTFVMWCFNLDGVLSPSCTFAKVDQLSTGRWEM